MGLQKIHFDVERTHDVEALGVTARIIDVEALGVTARIIDVEALGVTASVIRRFLTTIDGGCALVRD